MLRLTTPLLGRLEDEHHTTLKVSGRCQVPGGAEQHGCVSVMATSVHDATVGRGMGKPGNLCDGKRVHVSAEPDPAVVAARSVDDADDTGAADPCLNLVHAHGTKLLRDDARSPVLFKTEFRMGVKVPEGGYQHIGLSLNFCEDRHVFLRK